MKAYLYLVMIALVGLAGCAGNASRPPMDVESFSLFSSHTLASPANKALYHPATQNLFILNSRTQEIEVYRDNERRNVIGGIGTGQTNFQNLSDICLATDGSLFALDSSTRTVKKFSGEGKVLGSLELKRSVQPTLIAAGSTQTLFVFDQASSEIIVYSALDGSEQNRFGRFQLEKLSSLICNRDFVVGYDTGKDVSHIFSALGQFVKTEPGQTVFDDYNNGINLGEGALTSQMSPAFLPLDATPGQMSITSDVLVLVSDTEVRMLKIGYKQVQ